MYPNPIRNGEYLHLNKIVKEVSIYNSQGRMIKKSNNMGSSILIDNFSSGMYFIKIGDDINKFIVK
ncbi:T9SS type A sorting domain-containing protein [Chryseobacterium arthrosphaerae]|uniref:T9SS type A sorting domain-containing protein n=1 Tax=Chryseobacterium arthrosphaerae TaxID=651561 RepID=UPI00374D6B79